MKKGQITIYIIIGLVLLIILSLSIYIFSSLQGEKSDYFAKKSIQDSVPEYVLPFKRYVEQCTNEVLWDAVQISGMQGGIIYTDDLDMKFNYYNPTESDGLMIFPEGDIKIPYWSHMMGDNECEAACYKMLQIPPLDGGEGLTIQNQIETYLEEHLPECMQDKNKLSPIGVFYYELGDVHAEVTFTSEEVEAKIDWLHEIEKGDERTQVRDFHGTIPVPYRESYDNALYLITILDEYHFLEKVSLNLISMYSGMKNDRLPPKDGSSIKYYSGLAWSAYETKEKISHMFSSYVPLITVIGSRNYHPIERFNEIQIYPLQRQVYANMEIPAEEDSFKDYNVHFMYSGWEPYFKLNDDDLLIRPEEVTIDFFPWFGINRVRTMYSMSYPLLISLSNPDVKNIEGKGFSFNVAYEVNFRNNDIMTQEFQEYDYGQQDQFLGNETFFCDYGMATSENVSFTLIDGASGSPVSDVMVSYKCGAENCNVGNTDEQGIFNKKVVPCVGGTFKLMKDGYETLYLNINPTIEHALDLGEITFEPYRYIDVQVKKQLITKMMNEKWFPSITRPQYMQENEKAMVQLERIYYESPEYIEREDFSTFVMIEGNTLDELKILPGTYDVMIQGVLNETVRILPKKRCYDDDGNRVSENSDDKEECVTVPDEPKTIDPYPGAGAYLNNESGLFTVTKHDLDGENSLLTMYEFYVDIPGLLQSQREVEDLEAMSAIERYSINYRELIDPDFS